MLNGLMHIILYEDWKDRTPIRAFSLPSVSVHSVSVSVSDGSVSVSVPCRVCEFDFTPYRSVYTRPYIIQTRPYIRTIYVINRTIYGRVYTERAVQYTARVYTER